MSDVLTQNDIFAIKEVEKKVEAEKGIPMGFVPVNFTSKGKLGPSVLHFRNYSMGEMLELVSATEDNQLSLLINRVLNQMCFEKYDCSKLHLDHIKEIMITIYKNFWGSSLKNKPFYKKLDIEDVDVEENIGYIDIDINKLESGIISEKFKIPFSIVDDVTKQKVSFTVPIVEHMFIAEKFVKEKYYKQDEKLYVTKNLTDTINALKEKKLFDEASKIKVDPALIVELEELEQAKARDALKITQAQLLTGVNGKELKTIEEKLEAFHTTVDASTWVRYAETIKEHASFGYNESYTFMYGDEKITRRFSFRFVDFIPSVDEKGHSGYTVSFDD